MRAPLAFLALLALPAAAQAGAVRCRLEHDVLIAPAEIAGVAGDFIIDTGQPATILAETQAQAAGFAGDQARGGVRLAGVRTADRAVSIADLDARTRTFDTPIAGVVGADVLRGYVVDIRFAPCWIALWRAGAAPRFRPSIRLPITWRSGAPTAPAALADGPTARQATLRLSTGLARPLSLSRAIASASEAPARLRALSFAGDLFETVPAVLEDPGESDGAVGAALLSRYRLRLDLPRGRVDLAPR